MDRMLEAHATLTEKAAMLREGLERDFPNLSFRVKHDRDTDTFRVTVTDPRTGRSGPLLREDGVGLAAVETVAVLLGKARMFVHVWLDQ